MEAIASVDENRLTQEERERNVHGQEWIFTYDPSVDYAHPAPSPSFEPIAHCHSSVEVWSNPPLPGPFAPDLCPGVELGKQGNRGFPTIASQPFRASLRVVPVVVHSFPTKHESLVLKRTHLDHKATGRGCASMIGTTVLTSFPFLREGRVHSVADATHRYYANGERRSHGKQKLVHSKHCQSIQQESLTRWAVDCGEVKVLLYIQVRCGARACVNVCVCVCVCVCVRVRVCVCLIGWLVDWALGPSASSVVDP